MWIYKILIYGGVILKKAMIYVHGKGGSYLEAEQFKNICLDFDVFGVDYNDYFPWIVKNKIMEVYDKISEKYDYIYAVSYTHLVHGLQKQSLKQTATGQLITSQN